MKTFMPPYFAALLRHDGHPHAPAHFQILKGLKWYGVGCQIRRQAGHGAAHSLAVCTEGHREKEEGEEEDGPSAKRMAFGDEERSGVFGIQGGLGSGRRPLEIGGVHKKNRLLRIEI